MDVRAADAAGLTVKRLELEKTQPVNQKAHSGTDGKDATKAADGDQGKHPKEHGQEHKLHPGVPNEESGAHDESTPEGEHHILDVKV
jgi:hypothetical protein